MESDKSENPDFVGRTLLISPSASRELVAQFERNGARVVTWPNIEARVPEDFTRLDETIENLFGYDWLLFRTVTAFEFFLKRFQSLGYEISDLDSLRVCAIGKSTVAKLETSQIHIDLIPDIASPDYVFEAIENFVGGRTALSRLNFLVPRTSAATDRLTELLEDAEARVDSVIVGRTVTNPNDLAKLAALLNGGAIDLVAFDKPTSVEGLAELLDLCELARTLSSIKVFCTDEETSSVARDYGLHPRS